MLERYENPAPSFVIVQYSTTEFLSPAVAVHDEDSDGGP
jgi:hypothetical protein